MRSVRAPRVALVAVIVPMLAACLPTRSGDSGALYASPSAHLTIGTTTAIGSLDPASGDPLLGLVAADLYQTLLQLAPSGAVVPEAATCSSRDATAYECVLVPGQAFSNGDPVTAQDVVYSIRRARRLGSDVTGGGDPFAPMTKLVAEGNTVIFTLSRPDPGWLNVLASSRAAIVDRRTFAAAHLAPNSDLVGSGPYELSQPVATDALLLVANPHYGGGDHRNNATVTVKYTPSDKSLASDLAAGAIDIAVPSSSPSALSALQTVPDVRTAQGAVNEIRYLGFDDGSMPGNGADHRQAIREAVAHTIDRSAIVSTLYGDAAEPLPQDAASPDAVAAASDLDAAGVVGPVEMTLVYNQDHLVDSDLATAVQAQLDGTGLFKVTLRDVLWSSFQSGVASGKYGMFLFGGGTSGMAGLDTDLSDASPVIPLWQHREVLVASPGVSGLGGALAVPGNVRFWELGAE